MSQTIPNQTSPNQTSPNQIGSGQVPADLQALVQQLVDRVGQLEDEVAQLRSSQQVPEDVMVAISAAVSAFLGHKAKVRAVRLASGRAWAQEGRGRVHNRQVLHVR